jgi:hypothetical protein
VQHSRVLRRLPVRRCLSMSGVWSVELLCCYWRKAENLPRTPAAGVPGPPPTRESRSCGAEVSGTRRARAVFLFPRHAVGSGQETGEMGWKEPGPAPGVKRSVWSRRCFGGSTRHSGLPGHGPRIHNDNLRNARIRESCGRAFSG